MTLAQLKYFQAICQYKNMTRAACALHISQPSLSTALRELESEFGITLFYRRSHGLELTDAGQYLYVESSRILEDFEQMTRHLKRMSQNNQTITLGLPAMSGRLVFTHLLQALSQISPDTHIQVIENGSLANRSKVQDDLLDAAIITRQTPLPPSFHYETLRHVNISLYISSTHPIAKKGFLEVADLSQLSLAMMPADTFLAEYIENYYHKFGLIPKTIVRTNQLATIQQLIESNVAAAFLLEHSLEESTQIVKLSIPDLPPAEIDLIWKANSQISPGLKALILAARSLS